MRKARLIWRVIDTGRPLHRGSGVTDGGEKQRCQDRDDCDGDEQLDQCEGALHSVLQSVKIPNRLHCRASSARLDQTAILAILPSIQ